MTLEELLDRANKAGRESRYVTTRDEQLKKGLDILYQQGEEISLQSNEILALNLTELELKTLLRLYTQDPQKKSLPGSSATQKSSRLSLTEHLIRLSGHISPADAKAFQTISDKMGGDSIEMRLLVDDEAIFTIGSTLDAKAPYMELPDNWEQWETEWGHTILAYWVTQIWGKENANIHKSIGDELRDFKLMIDEPTMDIHNIRGEQKVLSNLNKIIAHHPVEEYNTPEKQRRFTKLKNTINSIRTASGG